MYATTSSETLVPTHQPGRRHMSEEGTLIKTAVRDANLIIKGNVSFVSARGPLFEQH
jgi:hypothetical protein